MANSSAFNSDASSQPSRQLQLVVHAGPLAGKGFPITKEMLTFGRDPDNDITVDDTQVSRHHARLLIQGDEIIIEDLGSTNGTKVNGKPISGKQVLQPADIISIGASVFGVKGFAAPSTVGLTQLSSAPPDFPGAAASSPAGGQQPKPPSSPAPVASPTGGSPGSPSRLTFLAIGGIAAFIVIVLIIAGVTAYLFSQNQPTTADIPTVVITAPTNNAEVPVDAPVTVQATGSDPVGVKRMELWVRGAKTSEAVSPAAQGQPTLTASFQWTPEAPGTYTLEVRAYNQRDVVSAPTTVTVNVVAENGDSGGTPSGEETTTPEPVETLPGSPSLTTKTDLNVRGGPGIEYDLLGLLPTNSEAEIIGRDQNRQWWQIRFTPASDERGWVAADPAFSTAVNVESVPVAQPPPTPTGTPTATTVPPTETATPTPTVPAATATEAPPTDTPTPEVSPTPTEEPTGIEFEVSPTSIQGGDCVTVSWNVSGVKEVYVDDLPVGGEGSFQDCPNNTTTYRLRVVNQDNSQETQEIQVEVTNPVSVKSSGTLEMEPGDTLDIDDGDIPGDDFVWDVDDDDGSLETQDDVEIAPLPSVGSLNSISRSQCLSANYGVYSFLDGSESPSDPNNSIIDGRAVCFKTNKGRIGKLRIPQYDDPDELLIEWLTWQ